MSLKPARLDEIFAAALAETAPGARAVFLDEACEGDSALRQRVETLLTAHNAAGNFLQLPGGDATTPFATLSERPGSTIGRYKLLEQIGEGGFGVVFMADQEQPVRRRVALKIIKLGMDTKQVVARFEAERQALALMDHPNIAKVLDAGATETGRPYFVMELVRGVPITEYCDEARLTADERLALFQSVCAAVQHAHQKGIIHRDLKPSNVLVTLHDDKAVPKVIDFGVAKATQARLTERTLFTEFRQMVGTPAYMSPEQAQMSGLDVDTRSDVYSLGVLLYELLTGSTPIDARQLSSASYDDLRRLICDVEPPAPSARLATLPAAALTTLADRRHCAPTELAISLRSDLDWIVMKCLEKDRSRRFESASALALDVQRYLDGQPIEARPPSTGYRLKKFVRRYRGKVMAGGLVAAALLAGTAVATWQAVRATRAEKIAVAARADESRQRELAETRRQEADDARAEAERQRAAAVANSEKARQAVDEYFTLVSESTLLNVPGLQPLRKQLLDAALRFYEGLAAENTNDPAVLADLAVGYMRVAAINRSVDRNDDTAAAIDRALEAIQRLRSRFPDAHREHRRLAGFWKGIRDLTQTITLPKDPDVVLHSFHRLLELTKTLAEEYPDQTAFRGDLAALYFLTGDLHSDNLQARESLLNFGQAIAVAEQLVREQPNMPEHRADLARAYEQRGRSYNGLGRLNKAEADSAQALALREQLVAEFPKSPQYRGDLGVSLMQTCGFLIDRDPQQAKQVAGRAKDLFDALIQEYPEAAVYRSELRSAMKWLVASNIATGTPDQINEGMNLLHEWVATPPDDPRSQIESARMLRDMANRLQANKELQPLIEDVLRSSLAKVVKLSKQHPDNPELREQVGHFHRHLGFNDRDAGRWDEAKHHFEQAVAVFQRLADADIPQREGYYRWLVDSYADLTFVLMQDGKTEFAEAVLTDQLATSIRNHPKHVRLLRLRGEARARLGRWELAADDLRKVVELEPDNHWPYCLLATLLAQTGDVTACHDHCGQMLRRFSEIDNPGVAHHIVKFSLILPWPEADFPALSGLADTALAAGTSLQETPLFQLSKGLTEFRQGHFAAAADWMEKTLAAPSVHYCHAQAYMVLAMARHGLGEHEAARAAFEQGSEYIHSHVSRLDADEIGPNWADPIIVYALQREAETLLGLDAP